MRKAPTQQRAQATVQAILQAAAHILGRRGWMKFTTNEVAQAAGVSIGSLYQYFPNKLALAEALRERHLEAVLGALAPPGEAQAAAATIDQLAARLVDGVIAVHSIDPPLHRVLLEEVPLASRASLRAFEAEYGQRYRSVIAQSSGRRRSPRDDAAARVLAGAVEGVVHAAARQGDLGSPQLRRELTLMVAAYLRSRR
jgi:AcrR family transcriptional regulator